MTIYEQLKTGARYFDIRVSGYIKETVMEYWCGHSFLSVPLLVVLNDFIRFIEEHPTEVIVIDYRPDTRSFNADYLGIGNNKMSVVVELKT